MALRTTIHRHRIRTAHDAREKAVCLSSRSLRLFSHVISNSLPRTRKTSEADPMKRFLTQQVEGPWFWVLLVGCIVALVLIVGWLLSEVDVLVESTRIEQWLKRPVSEVKVWQLLIAIFFVCSLSRS